MSAKSLVFKMGAVTPFQGSPKPFGRSAENLKASRNGQCGQKKRLEHELLYFKTCKCNNI